MYRMEADMRAKADEERNVLNNQITKTMKLFQEQLAHTIKMAAMLQAQRIMSGQVSAAPVLAPQVELPHEVDEPPTREEIVEYARLVGAMAGRGCSQCWVLELSATCKHMLGCHEHQPSCTLLYVGCT